MDSSPPVPPPMPPGQQPAPDRTSGAAVASMILGILAFVTCGLTSIPAVICGHVSLSNIARSSGRLGGRGMALAGLITGYLSIVFLLLAVIAGISLPVFTSVKQRAEATRTMDQFKEIYLACQLYAEDHDGRYPEKLEELAPKYVKAERLIGPKSEAGEPTTIEYFGGSIKDPPDWVVAETAPQGRQRRRVILYGDGRVEYKPKSEPQK